MIKRFLYYGTIIIVPIIFYGIGYESGRGNAAKNLERKVEYVSEQIYALSELMTTPSASVSPSQNLSFDTVTDAGGNVRRVFNASAPAPKPTAPTRIPPAVPLALQPENDCGCEDKNVTKITGQNYQLTPLQPLAPSPPPSTPTLAPPRQPVSIGRPGR